MHQSSGGKRIIIIAVGQSPNKTGNMTIEKRKKLSVKHFINTDIDIHPRRNTGTLAGTLSLNQSCASYHSHFGSLDLFIVHEQLVLARIRTWR